MGERAVTEAELTLSPESSSLPLPPSAAACFKQICGRGGGRILKQPRSQTHPKVQIWWKKRVQLKSACDSSWRASATFC